MQCLTPPLSQVPAGEWFCTHCLSESFGFGSGRVFRFHQYERQANAFKSAFFESLFETATTNLTKKQRLDGIAHDAEARAAGRARLPDIDVPPKEVEWQFWNIVRTPDSPLEVSSALAEMRSEEKFRRVWGLPPTSSCSNPHLCVCSPPSVYTPPVRQIRPSKCRKVPLEV